MGNLSCVSCQTRKATEAKKNSTCPSSPSDITQTKPSQQVVNPAADTTADQCDVNIVQQKPQLQQQDPAPVDVPPPASSQASPPSAEVAVTVVDNATEAPGGHEFDDQKLLDWWCETANRSRELGLERTQVAPLNEDVLTSSPPVDVIASAIVQLTLYLASQVICPAIERYQAELSSLQPVIV